MNNEENFDDQEMKNRVSKYKVKPIPESLMKNYLAEVRSKIEIEKSKSYGTGFPVWMGAVVFTYTLALAFSFGVYWVEGRPDFSSPVIEVPEDEISMREVSVGQGLSPQGTVPSQSARPSSADIKIESDAELSAILSLLGEDENFLDEQELSVEMDRIDQLEIQGPQAAV